jgi:putative hydrolase
MKLSADLHIHTLASGHAYSTVEEIARAAAGRGLELLALTDHGPAMPGGPHEFHFGNLRVLPDVIHGVEILRGVEANIMDTQGTLDLREHYLRRLDIVLAGLHSYCLPVMDRERNTEALINALRNPFVDIIVHPGNPEFPVDSERLVRAALASGKALEINNSSFLVRRGSAETCREIAELLRHHGGLVSISSDAHTAWEVGELSRALELVLEVGIPEECILNLSAGRVKSFLAGRGKKRFTAAPEG